MPLSYKFFFFFFELKLHVLDNDTNPYIIKHYLLPFNKERLWIQSMDARNSPKKKRKEELWMIIRKRKRKNVMYIHDSQERFHKFSLSNTWTFHYGKKIFHFYYSPNYWRHHSPFSDETIESTKTSSWIHKE